MGMPPQKRVERETEIPVAYSEKFKRITVRALDETRHGPRFLIELQGNGSRERVYLDVEGAERLVDSLLSFIMAVRGKGAVRRRLAVHGLLDEPRSPPPADERVEELERLVRELNEKIAVLSSKIVELEGSVSSLISLTRSHAQRLETLEHRVSRLEKR